MNTLGYRKPAAPIHAPPRVRARVWDHVDMREAGECWPWTASVGSHGYGQIGWWADQRAETTTAHRVIWESVHGPIPDRLTVDHTCHNKLCANPLHLRLLTNIENALDGSTRSTNLRRTHCKNGHPFDEAHTYIAPNGDRSCRTCHNERRRLRRAEKKATF